MIENSHSSGSHRRRRKKSNTGRIGILGGLAGVLGIGAISHHAPVPVRAGGGQHAPSRTNGAQAVSMPKTGPTLSIANTDGYAYGIGAARGGTNNKPLPDSGTSLPSGSTYAYADYVLTNTGEKPALLDFPADLFMKRSLVTAAAQARCMPQAGAPDDMCTLPNHSAVIGYLNGSVAPISQDGDQYMPPGASYLVRVATDLPVSTKLKQTDMNLYIWDARYISDRKAVLIAFP
jgi:hypothetical protein